jgi:microcystin-dependent protein
MFAGAGTPPGYLLCFGQSTSGYPLLAKMMSTVPDLRNRFIIGAGSSYGIGATGGESTVSLSSSQIPGHSHGLGSHWHSVGSHAHSQPSHQHGPGSHVHYPDAGGELLTTGNSGTNFGVANGTFYTFRGRGNTSGPSQSGATSPAGGDNTGSASLVTGTTDIGNSGSVGGGGSHENKPPYYALAYCIRAY